MEFNPAVPTSFTVHHYSENNENKEHTRDVKSITLINILVASIVAILIIFIPIPFYCDTDSTDYTVLSITIYDNTGYCNYRDLKLCKNCFINYTYAVNNVSYVNLAKIEHDDNGYDNKLCFEKSSKLYYNISDPRESSLYLRPGMIYCPEEKKNVKYNVPVFCAMVICLVMFFLNICVHNYTNYKRRNPNAV